MSITITQIAKLAGVSRGTVDRVIHQRGRVAPEVEKRIRDIMDENDYHPNMLGRALAVSKTPLTIGMIMIEKGNPFFQLIHRDGCQVRGYRCARESGKSHASSVGAWRGTESHFR